MWGRGLHLNPQLPGHSDVGRCLVAEQTSPAPQIWGRFALSGDLMVATKPGKIPGRLVLEASFWGRGLISPETGFHGGGRGVTIRRLGISLALASLNTPTQY